MFSSTSLLNQLPLSFEPPQQPPTPPARPHSVVQRVQKCAVVVESVFIGANEPGWCAPIIGGQSLERGRQTPRGILTLFFFFCLWPLTVQQFFCPLMGFYVHLNPTLHTDFSIHYPRNEQDNKEGATGRNNRGQSRRAAWIWLWDFSAESLSIYIFLLVLIAVWKPINNELGQSVGPERSPA